MTTVTVSDDTHRKLKQLKEARGANSFNELLEEIADEELEIPDKDEMFGSGEVKDRSKVKDREDRTDRYE